MLTKRPRSGRSGIQSATGCGQRYNEPQTDTMFKVLLLMISVQWSTLAATRDELLEYENVVDTNKYNFRYITHSGVTREEAGELTNPGTPEEEYVVKGRFVNFFPDGSQQIVEYVADRFGYRPKITFLTSAQLLKKYIDAASERSTAKPEESKLPQSSPDDEEFWNRFIADNDNIPPPGDHSVEQNLLDREPVQRRPISEVNATKPVEDGYKQDAPNQTLSDDDDEYDLGNRICFGAACALAGTG